MSKNTGWLPAGFTLVEVLVAIFILTVGVLAMGMSTGHVMAQIQAAELRTERTTAFRQASETLRGSDWDTLENTCTNAGDRFDSGHYSVGCYVSSTLSNNDVKVVRIVASGPGFRGGQFTTTISDTFSISIAAPVN